jgi:ABC-type dipeptide/oligopeptide/nickel transport system permease component
MVPLLNRPASHALIVIGQRLFQGLFTAFTAVSFTFFALRLAAGDPLSSLLAQGLTTPQQAQQLRISLGLDQPLLKQYLDFISSLFKGNLGVSLYTHRSVLEVISEQFQHTAALALFALTFAILLGFGLGIIAAWKRGTARAYLSETVSGLATSLPVSFTGILAIIVLSFSIRTYSEASIILSIKDLILPATVLGFASSGAIARVVQAGLEESMLAPYMLAARARGIKKRGRLLWHALRPSLPPAISLVAIEGAFLLAGTVVTETVFSRPGLGRLLVSSILQGDYPIAQGIVVLAALVYTLSQSAADILAFIIDPRLERVN